MGSKERKERERNDVRARIMSAARDLFASEGVDAVSMRKIADAVEYSPTIIYQHFTDKDALLREICQEDFASLAGTLIEIARIEDPVERIKGIGVAYCQFGLAYPNHYRLMFMTPYSAARVEESELCEKGKGNPDEDAYAFLRKAVSEAIEAKRFREDLTDPDLISQILWSGVHGVVSLQITKQNDPWIEWFPFDQRVKEMVDALVIGLSRPKAEGSR
jgi:AcrR family transcriptional regulator